MKKDRDEGILRLLGDVIETLREDGHDAAQTDMDEMFTLMRSRSAHKTSGWEESSPFGGEDMLHKQKQSGSLPEGVRRDLHTLLDTIAAKEEAQTTRIHTVEAVETSETCEESTELDDPLEDTVLAEPESVPAIFFLHGSSFAMSSLRSPGWIEEGEIALPVANTQVDEHHTFDQEGGEVSCQLSLGGGSAGWLQIGWKAEHLPPGGWWVAFFLSGSHEAIFDEILGTDVQGEVVFDASVLGFDPHTPFHYLVYPR